jgi:hypothetical protein
LTGGFGFPQVRDLGGRHVGGVEAGMCRDSRIVKRKVSRNLSECGERKLLTWKQIGRSEDGENIPTMWTRNHGSPPKYRRIRALAAEASLSTRESCSRCRIYAENRRASTWSLPCYCCAASALPYKLPFILAVLLFGMR